MDIPKYIIYLSLEDTIGILDASPHVSDLVPQINVIRMMNRASIGHLGIERAMKFLIQDAGGNFRRGPQPESASQ